MPGRGTEYSPAMEAFYVRFPLAWLKIVEECKRRKSEWIHLDIHDDEIQAVWTDIFANYLYEGAYSEELPGFQGEYDAFCDEMAVQGQSGHPAWDVFMAEWEIA